eukprot:653927-Rhodomonas_salina.1
MMEVVWLTFSHCAVVPLWALCHSAVVSLCACGCGGGGAGVCARLVYVRRRSLLGLCLEVGSESGAWDM